jgi:hypothetical protein
MKTHPCGFVLSLLMFISLPVVAAGSDACSETSKLTDDEARILLYVSPVAISARNAGTDIDIEKSATTKQFPADDYFVAAIVSQKPTGGGVLGNGILGYFAVDKRTASVESTSDFTPVKGKELARIQVWIRNIHCIQAQDLPK